MPAAFGSGFNSNYNRGFSAGATITFAKLIFAADVSVVQFDDTVQGIGYIPVLPGFTDFVAPEPCCGIRQIKVMLKLQG